MTEARRVAEIGRPARVGRVVGLVDPQQLAHHPDRERIGEIPDDVELALLCPGEQHGPHPRADPRPQGLDRARREGARDEPSQVVVEVAVAIGQHARPPRVQRSGNDPDLLEHRERVADDARVPRQPVDLVVTQHDRIAGRGPRDVALAASVAQDGVRILPIGGIRHVDDGAHASSYFVIPKRWSP
jgi:hypothetical protein